MLEVTRLSAGYGAIKVIDDVSLRIPTGGVVALLGRNGAGKTTLLKAISGLLRVRSGSIRLDGSDITNASAVARVRAGICQIPEGRAVFSSLSVRENLLLFAVGSRSERAQGISLAYTAFPILAKRSRLAAGDLSGGEQQMLALARAYMARPQMVLVDEASLGLAPKAVDSIFTGLRELAASGCALLVVEQYVTRVLEFATSAVLLNRGRVVFAGASKNLDRAEILNDYLGVPTE